MNYTDAAAYNKSQVEAGLLTFEHIAGLVEYWQSSHDLTMDGKCGPATVKSIEKAIYGETGLQTDLQKEIVRVAIAELGNGEEGGDDLGKHVQKYRDAAGKGIPVGAWCACFASYCIKTAYEKVNNIAAPQSIRDAGALNLFRKLCAAGKKVTLPAPGDIMAWTRGAPESGFGHVGIVEKYENGIVHTVEGNKGHFPSKVARFQHDLTNEPKLVGFARLV